MAEERVIEIRMVADELIGPAPYGESAHFDQMVEGFHDMLKEFAGDFVDGNCGITPPGFKVEVGQPREG